MIEGRPQQDLTSKGEKIEITPIYGNKSVSGHEGDPKDIQPDKEDKSSVGGDISQ